MHLIFATFLAVYFNKLPNMTSLRPLWHLTYSATDE